MKFGAIVIAALIISAIAAHFLLGDPGYVAINFRGYLVEMSVPVLVSLVVLLVIAIWLIRRPRRKAAGQSSEHQRCPAVQLFAGCTCGTLAGQG